MWWTVCISLEDAACCLMYCSWYNNFLPRLLLVICAAIMLQCACVRLSLMLMFVLQAILWRLWPRIWWIWGRVWIRIPSLLPPILRLWLGKVIALSGSGAPSSKSTDQF